MSQKGFSRGAGPTACNFAGSHVAILAVAFAWRDVFADDGSPELAYTKDELRGKILGFIHSEIQDKTVELAMETPIERVKIDSIDVIHVVFKVEEEFKTEVSLSNEVSYKTVGEFVDALIGFIPQEMIKDA